MKHGSINASVLKVIFTGAGGVGKTHTVCLLRGVDPPGKRNSTECTTKAVTLRVDVSDSEKWEEINLEKRRKIIAEGISAAKDSLRVEEQEPVSTLSSPQEPLPKPEKAESPPPENVQPHSPKPEQKVQPPPPEPKTDETPQQQPEVDPKPQSETALLLSQSLEDLLKSIHELTMSGEVSEEVKWVYVVDTGGQPLFHEVLSAFIKGAAACGFVFKLSESLNHRPLVEYWRDGELTGESFEHPLSNRQILEQSIQTIQAFPSSDESPLLFVIGTHRDKKDNCTDETLEDKERTLRDIIEQSGCNFQHYVDKGVDRVVFDVNAKEPGDRDKELASTLRGVIAAKLPESTEMPLLYYGLELVLEHLAPTKGVISMKECLEIGDRLSFDEKGLKAALRFLHGLNALLYYPEVTEVKELIFCDPLFLMKIISKVVECISTYKGAIKEKKDSSKGGITTIDTDWKESCERGVITIKQLNTKLFDGCFRSEINFTPTSLFQLFEHLLIVAKVKEMGPVKETDQEFFMPCLLDDATQDETSRLKPEHCSPLAFVFLNKKGKSVYAPSGLFSALVAFLLSLTSQDLKVYSLKNIADAESCDNVCRSILSRLPSADITSINLHTGFEVFTICQTDYLPGIGRIMFNEANQGRKFKDFNVCSWIILGIEKGGRVYRNIIKFHSSELSAHITLINFHTRFEVFAECRANCLPTIRNIILKGLDEAKRVRFEHVDYREGFICKCPRAKDELHLAEIDIDEKNCSCPYNPGKQQLLETTELVWFGERPASKLQC